MLLCWWVNKWFRWLFLSFILIWGLVVLLWWLILVLKMGFCVNCCDVSVILLCCFIWWWLIRLCGLIWMGLFCCLGWVICIVWKNWCLRWFKSFRNGYCCLELVWVMNYLWWLMGFKWIGYWWKFMVWIIWLKKLLLIMWFMLIRGLVFKFSVSWLIVRICLWFMWICWWG